jgi:2'-5' RNA ligase
MLVRDELAPRIPPRSVRWVRRHQLHLTLRFLGDTLAIEVPQLIVRLGQACRGAASLRLGLRGVGVFPHVRQPRVVWAGLTGELDALVALQQRVAAACDPVAEQHEARAFRPHLTLGRVATHDRGEARAVGDAVASSAVGELGAWNVDRILLIHSRLRPEGPLHDTVAAMELSAAD